MSDLIQRDSYKNTLIKIIKYINCLNVEDVHLSDLVFRQKCMNETWNHFQEVHQAILLRTGIEGADLQHTEYNAVEDVYFEAASKLEGYIQSISVHNQENSVYYGASRHSNPSNRSNRSSLHIRYPETSIHSIQPSLHSSHTELSNHSIQHSQHSVLQISTEQSVNNSVKLQTIFKMINNISNFAMYEAQMADEGTIKAYQQDLERLYKQYEQIAFDQLHSDTSGRTSISLSQLHMMYRRTVAILFNSASKFEVQSVVHAINSNQTLPISRNEIKCKLPSLNPPKFNGTVLGWESFRDLYISTIHDRTDLSNVVKFQYLKSCMEGEGQELLTNFAITNENYLCAWQMLIDRFDNKKVLVAEHMRYLMSMSSCGEKEDDLKNLLNNTNKTVRALQNLGRPIEHWADWIILLVVDRLDTESRKLWEQSQSLTMEFSTWPEMQLFLQGRIRAVSAFAGTIKSMNSNLKKTSSTQQKCNNSIRAHQITATTSNLKCVLCNKPHYLSSCFLFKRKSLLEKRNFVKNKQLCFNCLKSDHSAENCPSQQNCRKCSSKHHTFLHLDPNGYKQTFSSESAKPLATNTAIIETSTQNIVANTPLSCASLLANTRCAPVLLATALVSVKNSAGAPIVLRALLDQGSQASFITEAAVQALGLIKKNVNVSVTGIGSTQASVAKSCVTFQCSSHYDFENCIQVDALVLKTVTSLPSLSGFLNQNWTHIVGLQLADPEYHQQDRVDMLLGADIYGRILLNDVRHGPPGLPTAQSTIFGWILSGQLFNANADANQHTTFNSHCSISESIDDLLKTFWEIETIPNRRRCLTTDERNCEEFFASSYRRNSEGRFIVRLPFIKVTPSLGSSERIAFNQMVQVEKRFQKNPVLKKRYTEFMQQYLNLGHMEEIVSSNSYDSSLIVNYIPHHAVFNESSSTTKIRVVFDATRKSSNGLSLNEQFHIGPRLQQDLTAIIMRWRKHAIAFTADIEKMYRQIQVDDRDCDLQRILWRDSSNEKMKHFRLTTVTYGTSSAPYLAVKSLRQLAEDEKEKYPIGSKIALNDFYVDDVLSGGDDFESAVEAQRQLNDLMGAGKFVLKKWTSNSEELLQKLPPDYLECSLPLILNLEKSVKTLGVYWNPALDVFGFKIQLPQESSTPTKRNLLSDAARLFDPLGWLAPTVVIAKMCFQELWRLGLKWDDPLPSELADKWLSFRTDLILLEQISIPRWLGTLSTNRCVQIHGFCDASMMAYAATVYVRVIDPNGKIDVYLLTAKTRVAPIKTISIPRLELCGAVLLSELLDSAVESMAFENISVHAWTDSTIVLAWLNGNPMRWNVFVANRVTAILQSNASKNQWRHVISEENPADCASRGIPPSQLRSFDLWWKGPTWLSQPEDMWPSRFQITDTSEEQRKSCHNAQTINSWDFIDKFSSLSKLTRVLAYIQRFWSNCRLAVCNRKIGSLTTSELTSAGEFLIRTIQTQFFGNEIKQLTLGLKISKSSRIIRLSPFIDDKGILRVGGRLQQSMLSYNERHPIIISRASHFSDLLIRHAHLQNLHGGVQATLGFLRRKYWLLDGRNQVRHHIRHCIRCFRQKANTQTQIMANLPSARVTPSRPFLHTAVDYTGFIKVRSAKGRGHHSTKAYVALFVCMATKAIHLEVVSDLSSAGFLAAFRRFAGRRGICTDLYSDNGTNFVGASSDLRRHRQAAARGQTIEILESLSNDGTTWHFSPPFSPHFNGLAEAGIRSTKYHIKRVIGESTLTFEELSTVLIQIEACLNSRPLSALTTDPDDLSPLTPGHFLIGMPINTIPEESLLDLNPNRLSRWQAVQQMVQQFWKRWSREYIHHLQQRSKWSTVQPDLQIGNMVLMKDDNLPPSKWELGRITEVRTGSDGHVRVVRVRHGHTESNRPIVKLALLPFPTNN